MGEHAVGLDVSLSSTGMIILSPSGKMVVQKIIPSDPTDGTVAKRMKRIESIVRSVLDELKSFPASVICIEGYSHGHNQPGLAERIELGGLLRYTICRECDRVYEVAPSTLKKFSTGAGNAKGKTVVAVALFKRYGVELSGDDEYDAYALARMAYQISGYEMPSTKQQEETIATVTTPKVPKPRKPRKAKT